MPAHDVVYGSDGSFGCDRVAEGADASTAYGGDLQRRARQLDRELMQLARDDGVARRVLGRLAGRFMEVCGFERLGFARLGDYAAERLGWSGRQLQEIARVAGALARLPLIERAVTRGDLGWSKARLLASIASPSDEKKWLAVAATTDVRSLAAATSSARAAMREQRHLPDTPHAAADRTASSDDEDDQQERVLVRVPCSQRGRRMWNDVRRLAPRMAGRALAQWEVAELVAAEASSAPGPFGPMWEREPWRGLGAAQTHGEPRRGLGAAQTHGEPRRAHPRGELAADPTPSSPDIPAAALAEDTSESTESSDYSESTESSESPVESPMERELARAGELDAFELDAAMRRVRRAMQQRQARLGATLGQFVDLRLHEPLGYACSADYIRERLGMSDRTARELVRVAKAAENKSPVLASAYAGGELSWLRVLELLPVVRSCNATQWVARAGEVTLRRLADEVAWASERADLSPEFSAMMPPAPGQDLGLGDGNGDRQMCARCTGGDQVTRHSGNDERQMCARCTDARNTTDKPRDVLWGILGRIHVTFVAPLPVSVLFRSAMQSFASPLEPRWKAFERMLEHVLAQWHSQPRHRDPVFARDGHRCSAPACTSFRNLHDHHIVPRSAGGTNKLSNRTTLCAWHHLRGVHGGLARATGQAPDAIDWELGLPADAHKAPLMRLRGDRYHSPSAAL